MINFQKYLFILLIVGILLLPKIIFSEELYSFETPFAAEALEELTQTKEVEVFQEKLKEIISSVFPSLTPPVISDIKVENITENSAEIFWRTNVKSSSIVAFVSAKDYDSKKENPYLIEVGNSEERKKEHRVKLLNLTPGTVYHFQVKSTSLPDITAKSKDHTFSTLAYKIKLEVPKVSNEEIEVRWTTGVETDSYVEYKNLKTGKTSKIGESSKTKTHIITLTDLTPDTPYEIKGFGYDINNILIETDSLIVKTKIDVTPPKIFDLRIDNALMPGRRDLALTVISWRTDELANSLVNFEEGVGLGEELKNQAGQKEEFVLEHRVILTTKTGTVYRIQIISSDQSKNESKSSVRTILTPRGEESILDIIIKNFQETFKFLRFK